MLIQLEKVDDVCVVCDRRHTPIWLERLIQADPWLKRSLYGTPDPNWVNVHMFTKRAFVPLNSEVF